MREPLYRGKRVDNDEWAYGGIVHQTDYYGDKVDRWFIIDGTETNDYSIGYPIEVVPETVGQYTGLKDKNGKMIFEGDIVRYGDTIHEVVFEQRNGTAYFGVVYSMIETLPFGHYQDLNQIEVIGNIHDNSELLKGE